jgi:uncharacterized repeat protein (TIGR03803 family)
LKTAAGFRNNLVLAGISSLAFAALAPLPTLAAPGITLQDSFNGTKGRNPVSALTAAGNGLYYGTTQGGGANDTGAIFAFDSATGSITLKASFQSYPSLSGAIPVSSLTAAGNGLYYGTTRNGGANGTGAIFAFDSATDSITLQGSFAAAFNGATPQSGLTSARNGLYYGTTQDGGTGGTGAIFAFDSATGSITLQSSFAADYSNGAFPQSGLNSAGNGLYYGTTPFGGANNDGAIYEFDSSTGSITLKHSFTAGSNGSNPTAALTAAGNGLYYGTTYGGGANGSGVIFAFDSATGSVTLQSAFPGDRSQGSSPVAELTAAANGLYYGTTRNGGATNRGTIFAFDSSTGSITLQGSFDGSNGADPFAALTAAGNGFYYGTTLSGGTNNYGTIYAFDSGVRDANPIPGPLPLMGAGAAFGWSRRLRRRIQPVRPLFPIGR